MLDSEDILDATMLSLKNGNLGLVVKDAHLHESAVWFSNEPTTRGSPTKAKLCKVICGHPSPAAKKHKPYLIELA
jgi:hypothetical protein